MPVLPVSSLLALQDATQLQLRCACDTGVCAWWVCVRVRVPSSQVVQVALNVVPVTAAAAAVVTAAVTAVTATAAAAEAAAAAAATVGPHCDARRNTRQHDTDTMMGWMRCDAQAQAGGTQDVEAAAAARGDGRSTGRWRYSGAVLAAALLQ